MIDEPKVDPEVKPECATEGGLDKHEEHDNDEKDQKDQKEVLPDVLPDVHSEAPSDTMVVIKENKEESDYGVFYGKCKWFSDKSGYGFITIEGRTMDTSSDKEEDQTEKFPVAVGKEVFVHFSGINPVNSTYRTLVSGEYVFFDIVQGTKDFQAVHVTGINGGPLMCDSNPNTKTFFPKSIHTLGIEKELKKDEKGVKDNGKDNQQQILGRYDGRCKWFNDKSGYGFLVIESGDIVGKDVFVHYSGIKPVYSGYKTLVSGEYLTFNIIKGVKDIQAIDVSGYNGGTMMCDTNHVPKTSHSIHHHYHMHDTTEDGFKVFKSRSNVRYKQENARTLYPFPNNDFHASSSPSPPPPPPPPPPRRP